ncbi:hypothetical protein NDU88_009770 [Pleurodeles waltl]|uniref:Uncharacterized protein n=1 Tax=Pleurodeles waltl TaxID=8319 RepID=A0AAV7PY49_PLEWA|nr:hypothetical protein NDU88_009770 [Pleurodeles waltl]
MALCVHFGAATPARAFLARPWVGQSTDKGEEGEEEDNQETSELASRGAQCPRWSDLKARAGLRSFVDTWLPRLAPEFTRDEERACGFRTQQAPPDTGFKRLFLEQDL